MSVHKIMIYAEVQWGCDCGINHVYYELLSKAKELYGQDGAEFAALVLGKDATPYAESLSKSGVDAVYVLDNEKLAFFNCDYFSAAACEAIRSFDADLVLIGATAFGEELAPTLGIRLQTGVAAHCVDFIRKEDGALAHMVPAFGGKVIGEIFIKDSTPQIASSKPGLFTARAEGTRPCTIHQMDSRCIEDPSKITVVESGADAVCGIPLGTAQTVVCAGFGVGDGECFSKVQALAARLGGAVGCTRPAVDQGWMDESHMIGTSGRSVKPKLYIGFGVSGAAHHLCGIKNAGVIISVNTDPGAEVFATSDYKVVADAHKLLPVLLEKLG